MIDPSGKRIESHALTNNTDVIIVRIVCWGTKYNDGITMICVKIDLRYMLQRQ